MMSILYQRFFSSFLFFPIRQARLGAAAIEALDAGAFDLSPAPAAAAPSLLRTNVAANLPVIRLPSLSGAAGPGETPANILSGALQPIRLPQRL